MAIAGLILTVINDPNPNNNGAYIVQVKDPAVTPSAADNNLKLVKLTDSGSSFDGEAEHVYIDDELDYYASGNVEGALQELASTVNGAIGDINTVNGRVDTLVDTVDTLNSTLGGVQDQVEAINNTIGDFYSSYSNEDTITKVLVRLNGTIGDGLTMDDVNGVYGVLFEEVADVNGAVGELNETVGSLADVAFSGKAKDVAINTIEGVEATDVQGALQELSQSIIGAINGVAGVNVDEGDTLNGGVIAHIYTEFEEGGPYAKYSGTDNPLVTKNGVEGRVNTLRGELTGLISNVNNVIGEMGEGVQVNTAIGALETNFNTLDRTVNTINGTIEGIQGQVNTIEGLVGNTEIEYFGTLTNAVLGLNTAVGAAQTAADTAEENVENLNNVIGEMGEGVQVNTAIGALETGLGNLSDIIGDGFTNENTVTGVVQGIQEQLDNINLNASSIAFEDTLEYYGENTVQGALTMLANTVNGIAGSTVTSVQVGETDPQTGNVKISVADGYDSASNHIATVATVTNAVNGVNGTIGEMNGHKVNEVLGELKTNIDTVNETIDDLNSLAENGKVNTILGDLYSELGKVNGNIGTTVSGAINAVIGENFEQTFGGNTVTGVLVGLNETINNITSTDSVTINGRQYNTTEGNITVDQNYITGINTANGNYVKLSADALEVNTETGTAILPLSVNAKVTQLDEYDPQQKVLYLQVALRIMLIIKLMFILTIMSCTLVNLHKNSRRLILNESLVLVISALIVLVVHLLVLQ